MESSKGEKQHTLDGNNVRDYWISIRTKHEFTKQLFTKLVLIVITSNINMMIFTFVMIYHNVYVQRNRHPNIVKSRNPIGRLLDTEVFLCMKQPLLNLLL